jgi:hypothetical protein
MADAQFEKLVGELPAAVATEEIGDRSLRARGGDVLGLAFLLREKGLVVQLSCGTSQCTESVMLLRLAKLIDSHVGESRSNEAKSVGRPEGSPQPGKKPGESKGNP